MQILNLNTKCIESKHFIHYLKRFPQTLYVCFVLPSTSKHMCQCFLILVQRFRVWTFQESLIFSNANFHHFGLTFLLNGPDKKPKQNSSKTKQHSRQQEVKSVRRLTAVSQRDIFWRVVTGTLRWLASLHCLWYFLVFDWLRPAVLFFLKLDSLPISSYF